MAGAEAKIETVFENVNGIAAVRQLFGDEVIYFGDNRR